MKSLHANLELQGLISSTAHNRKTIAVFTFSNYNTMSKTGKLSKSGMQFQALQMIAVTFIVTVIDLFLI